MQNVFKDQNGNYFYSYYQIAKKEGVNKETVRRAFLKHNTFSRNNNTYIRDESVRVQFNTKDTTNVEELLNKHNVQLKELDTILKERHERDAVQGLSFEHTSIVFDKTRKDGVKYAVALFSDAHIEETVRRESVLGMNEYNLDIAKERIHNYFYNLACCVNKDEVKQLVFASLGDTITSYLHDENISDNQCTPIEATYIAQNLIFDGLKYLCDNTKLERIQFIGIVGNHSRITKKVQHSNGYKMSYEWLMYKNIEKECGIYNMPIDFYIPESEMFLTDMPDGKRFLFMHGFQIRGGGTNTICGIYPALNRLFLKLSNTFHQNHIFMGHFHSLTTIPNATVNGSIIGWNTFAMTNGMPLEEPMQAYIVYDTNIGELLSRKIYCK